MTAKQLLKVGLFSLVMVLFAACNNEEEVRTYKYENGYVRFNVSDGPQSSYIELRGKLLVLIYEDWVEVYDKWKDTEDPLVIPRKRISYIGYEIK